MHLFQFSMGLMMDRYPQQLKPAQYITSFRNGEEISAEGKFNEYSNLSCNDSRLVHATKVYTGLE